LFPLKKVKFNANKFICMIQSYFILFFFSEKKHVLTNPDSGHLQEALEVANILNKDGKLTQNQVTYSKR
jgi:hypothetical protein